MYTIKTENTQKGAIYDGEDRTAWRRMVSSALFSLYEKVCHYNCESEINEILGDYHRMTYDFASHGYLRSLVKTLNSYGLELDLQACEAQMIRSWRDKDFNEVHLFKNRMNSNDLEALRNAVVCDALSRVKVWAYQLDSSLTFTFLAGLILNDGYSTIPSGSNRKTNYYTDPAISQMMRSFVYGFGHDHLLANTTILTEPRPEFLALDSSVRTLFNSGALGVVLTSLANKKGSSIPFFHDNAKYFNCDAFKHQDVYELIKLESDSLKVQRNGRGKCNVFADALRHAYSIVIHSSVFTLEGLKSANVEVQEAYGFLALYLTRSKVLSISETDFIADSYYRYVYSDDEKHPSGEKAWDAVIEVDPSQLSKGINKAVKALLSL